MTGLHRTTFATTSALVGLAMAVIPLVLIEEAVAQEAAAAATTQAARTAGTYHMPHGDFTSGVVRPPEERTAIPLRTPMSTDELMRFKGQAAAERAAPSAIEVPPAAESRALFRECVTNVATGSAPSDIHGATTPSNLVVVTNVDIGVYNKTTCSIVSRVSLRSFFGAFGIPATQSLFDPRALYDRLNGRCLVIVESRDSINTDQFLYIAGSTSSSCTSWNLRRLTLSRVSTSALFCKLQQDDFYDYPNAGYNIRRLVVTSNNFTSRTGPFSNGTVLSFNTPALYANGAVFAACFNTGATGNLTPAVVGDGNTSMFILSPGNISISRRRLNAVLPNDSRSDTLALTSNITVANAPVPPDATQPNGQRLDTVDGRFVHATKQIGTSIWAVRSVNVGGFSRFRLYRLSTTGTTALFTFTPTTSTCANGDHLFNASVDTNSTVSGTLAFVTATRTCPSQAVAGRAAHLVFRGPNSSASGWVFNTVETSATNFATDGLTPSSSCNTTPPRLACRWGDYSSTQIDPSNTARAWGFNQLVTGSTQFNWNTRGGLVGP